MLLHRRFRALQEHIDELTREKYELLRGLATQRKVQESLEEESERFASDFNRQASTEPAPHTMREAPRDSLFTSCLVPVKRRADIAVHICVNSPELWPAWSLA